jgi:hypothetical protein
VVQVEVPAVIAVLAVLPLDRTVTMAAAAVATSAAQAVEREQQVVLVHPRPHLRVLSVLLGWGFQRQPAPTLEAAGLVATPTLRAVPQSVLLAVLG